LPPEIWGDGEAEGVRTRAAEHMANAAKACRKFMDAREAIMGKSSFTFKTVVNGFTGSSIWHALYSFPPTSQEYLQAGFDDFAKRFLPIMEVFEQEDVYFALEVHPTEIAFDIASAERTLEAIGHHKRFGFNYDPSHLGYQGTDFADPRRQWDFRSIGRGDVNFEEIIVALNDTHYNGPLSVEWEDARMNRFHGATESCDFVKKLDFPTNTDGLFDSAFDNSKQ